jgi:alpha-ketoglutarate-dependent taurine dioxygenase
VSAIPRRRPSEPVTSGPVREGHSLPYAYTACSEQVELESWGTANRDEIIARLHLHGAVLFRGFHAVDKHRFTAFVRSVSGEPLEYTERSSPRLEVGDHVYTSTEQPADQEIFLHNEHSYALEWPMRLFFFCERPAAAGGATPLADSRRILTRIPQKMRERFAAQGYAYTRVFRQGIGLSWRRAFGCEKPDEAEKYCDEHAISFCWLPDGSLRTTQVRPVIRRHPGTGEEVWFNHLTFFNVGTLRADLRETLSAELGMEEMPNNTYYGDGEPIEQRTLQVLQEAYRSELVAIPWRRGDVLMIDNMLAAHGREPFIPPREVLVAMTEPASEFGWTRT